MDEKNGIHKETHEKDPNGVHPPNAKEYSELDPLKEDAVKIEKRSWGETVRNVIRNVTVEPTMFLFVVSMLLTMLTSQNLGLDKACRVNLNFTTEICDALRNQNVSNLNSTYEARTQKLVAKYVTYKSIITSIVPCIVSLFIGSWSDRTGHRKIFMIVPVLGLLLMSCNNIINTYFYYQLPLEVLLFSEAVIEGFTGSWCILFLATFSFISSITTEESRTFRMGICSFCLTVGFPVGMGLSGILLKKIGFYGCYAIAGGISLLNILYTTFVLRDPPRTSDQKKHDGRGVGHFFRTFFDLNNVKATLTVVFKSGPNNRRLRVSLLFFVVCLLFGPMYGEFSVLYLSTRYRFNWDEVMFSLFQIYNFIFHTIGTVFTITVFSKMWQWHDAVLGILSTTSKIASSFVYCFAPNEKIYFIAPIVDILNGTALLATRSMVSKLVKTDELGKVNSIYGMAENLMMLLYVPMYSRMYLATFEALPGAFFLLSVVMTLPATIVFVWYFVGYKREESSKEKSVELVD